MVRPIPDFQFVSPSPPYLADCPDRYTHRCGRGQRHHAGLAAAGRMARHWSQPRLHRFPESARWLRLRRRSQDCHPRRLRDAAYHYTRASGSGDILGINAPSGAVCFWSRRSLPQWQPLLLSTSGHQRQDLALLLVPPLIRAIHPASSPASTKLLTTSPAFPRTIRPAMSTATTPRHATVHSIDNLALVDRVLGRVVSTLQASPRWNQTTLIVEGDHGWRIDAWDWLPAWTQEDDAASRGVFDQRPALIILSPACRLTALTIVAAEAWPLIQIHWNRGADPARPAELTFQLRPSELRADPTAYRRSTKYHGGQRTSGLPYTNSRGRRSEPSDCSR